MLQTRRSRSGPAKYTSRPTKVGRPGPPAPIDRPWHPRENRGGRGVRRAAAPSGPADALPAPPATRRRPLFQHGSTVQDACQMAAAGVIVAKHREARRVEECGRARRAPFPGRARRSTAHVADHVVGRTPPRILGPPGCRLVRREERACFGGHAARGHRGPGAIRTATSALRSAPRAPSSRSRLSRSAGPPWGWRSSTRRRACRTGASATAVSATTSARRRVIMLSRCERSG